MASSCLGRYSGLYSVSDVSSGNTAGLVHEFQHAVLPSVTPAATFVITLAAMAVSTGSQQKVQAAGSIGFRFLCLNC